MEKEKKEFKEYQKLDKERRSVEYNLYDKELRNAVEELEKVYSSSSKFLIFDRLKMRDKNIIKRRVRYMLNMYMNKIKFKKLKKKLDY